MLELFEVTFCEISNVTIVSKIRDGWHVLAAIQFLGAILIFMMLGHSLAIPCREANGQQRDKSEMCLGKILHL